MRLSILYCIVLILFGCLVLYIVKNSLGYLNIGDLNFFFNENSVTLINYDENFINVHEYNNESIQINDDLEDITDSVIKMVPLEEDIHMHETNEKEDINTNLVRKKRFLIFPEGSSFQIVFCLTYLSIVPIGDLIYFGATASLAWELPQDPYSSYKHHGDPLHRNDKGPVIYKDVNRPQKMNYNWGNPILVNRYSGKPIQKYTKDYYMKPMRPVKKIDQNSKKDMKIKTKHNNAIRPVFAKRSTENETEDNERNAGKNRKRKHKSIRSADREEMHKIQEQRKYLNVKHIDERSLGFHRTSRFKLFEKLEKLFIGIDSNGKECVLKALCEIGQDLNGKQGTFLEEIIRVIFTLPKSTRYHSKYLHYDQAHVEKYKCEEVYPQCTFSIKSLPI